MKKIFTFVVVALAAMTLNAEELSLGSNDSSCKYAPVYGVQGDRVHCSQVIYTADELEAIKGGKITKLTFVQRSKSNNDWSGISISLKEVDFDAFESTEFVSIDGATVIYSNNIKAKESLEVVLELATPFEYKGGNLLLDSRKTVAGGTYSSSSWKGFNATEQSSYRVNSAYNSSGTFPTEGVRSYGRPDVTITYVPAETTAIDNVEAEQTTVKRFENGQLVIIRDGVKYNAIGAIVK